MLGAGFSAAATAAATLPPPLLPPSPASEPLRPLLEALPSGTLLLCDRLDCSGAFLLPLLVRAAVQGGHRVVVLAAAHSPARHAAALRKLGVGGAAQQGAVAFVDAADAGPCPVTPGGEGDASADAAYCPALRRLLGRVLAAARDQLGAGGDACADGPCAASTSAPAVPAAAAAAAAAAAPSACRGLTLVLDSLPALLSLYPGASPDRGSREAAAFLAAARALGPYLGIAAGYRFAALAASDSPGDAGLLAAARHAAECVLELSAVEGRTAALDGRLDITLRRLPVRPAAEAGSASAAVAGELPATQAWLFRWGDTGVRWLTTGQLQGKELMV
jgi:hypothetical protein